MSRDDLHNRAMSDANGDGGAADTVDALLDRVTAAVRDTPVPDGPGIVTMPSFSRVPASATMSGTGVSEADRRSVLSPVWTGAGTVFAQRKLNCTSVGGNDPVGVIAKT